MAPDSHSYLPFSQRTGLAPVPPQLKLGEVTDQFRNLVYYAIHLEISRESYATYSSAVFKDGWQRVATDLHVRFLKKPLDTFHHGAYETEQLIKRITQGANIGQLFDFVEFMVRHQLCSAEMKRELASAFKESRAAYRLIDKKTVVAIGTDEQAEAFVRALDDAETKAASGTRTHLIAAGSALRDGDWVGCVRESIHAVESVVTRLEPTSTSLKAGLVALEAKGHLHGGLKAAFSSLYGYSSDEEGVRHALVFTEDAQVDEADALFMIGACASFVSYVLARVG